MRFNTFFLNSFGRKPPQRAPAITLFDLMAQPDISGLIVHPEDVANLNRALEHAFQPSHRAHLQMLDDHLCDLNLKDTCDNMVKRMCEIKGRGPTGLFSKDDIESLLEGYKDFRLGGSIEAGPVGLQELFKELKELSKQELSAFPYFFLALLKRSSYVYGGRPYTALASVLNNLCNLLKAPSNPGEYSVNDFVRLIDQTIMITEQNTPLSGGIYEILVRVFFKKRFHEQLLLGQLKSLVPPLFNLPTPETIRWRSVFKFFTEKVLLAEDAISDDLMQLFVTTHSHSFLGCFFSILPDLRPTIPLDVIFGHLWSLLLHLEKKESTKHLTSCLCIIDYLKEHTPRQLERAISDGNMMLTSPTLLESLETPHKRFMKDLESIEKFMLNAFAQELSPEFVISLLSDEKVNRQLLPQELAIQKLLNDPNKTMHQQGLAWNYSNPPPSLLRPHLYYVTTGYMDERLPACKMKKVEELLKKMQRRNSFDLSTLFSSQLAISIFCMIVAVFRLRLLKDALRPSAYLFAALLVGILLASSKYHLDEHLVNFQRPLRTLPFLGNYNYKENTDQQVPKDQQVLGSKQKLS